MAGPGSAPLVGRDGPLADLGRRAAAAATGRPQVVVVLGEAGIGKTRLVDELVPLVERDGFITTWGGCAAGAARVLPLAPVRDLLDRLHRTLGPRLGRLVRGGPAAVEALAPLLGLDEPAGGAGPAASQAQVFDAVARLLRDVGRARGLLVVVEDVHWADETSRDLVEFLARSLRDERILLVVTARTDDPAFESCRALVADLAALRHGTRVELDRLSPEEVGEQLASLRGERGTDADLSRIVALTEGVPLLVEEVADADLHDVARLADRLLGHRIDRLTPAAREVVETAALAVLQVSPEQLARATPLPPSEFDGAFAEAVTAGVLVRHDGSVGFRHALLREAAQARTAPHAETAAHRRWSAVLGDDPDGLDQLVAAAHHRRRAGDAAGALVACVRASRAAQAISAYAEERQLLLDAAELWPSVPDAEARTGTTLVDLYLAATWCTHLAAADVAEAQRLIDLAVEALPADATPHRRAMVRLLWHRTRWSGDDHLSTEEVLRCVADVEMEPPTEEAMLACLEAVDALLQAGEAARAEEFGHRAVAIAEALDRPAHSSRALGSLALTQMHLHQDAAALRTAERAVVLGERAGDLFVLAEALSVLELVQWLAGRETLEVDRRLRDLLGGERPGPLPGRWGIAQANHAESLIDSGDWDEAQRVLRLVLDEQLPGWIYWAAKRLEEHLLVLRGGVPERTPDTPAAPRRDSLDNTNLEDLLAARYTYADIAARLGDLSCAREQVASVVGDDRIVDNTGFLYPLVWVAARVEAELALSGTDPEPAAGDAIVARLHALLELAPARNDRDAAYAAHARADLERRAGADTPEQWMAVVEAWRRGRHPFPLATALVRAGAAYVAAGRPDEARELLREAAALAGHLGARPLAEEAAAVARAAHLRVPASAAPASALGLTARELEVLRLVAEGASNGAIARALVISPKTASVHVSNILAKLGVVNRGQAAAVAHREGLVLGAAPPR